MKAYTQITVSLLFIVHTAVLPAGTAKMQSVESIFSQLAFKSHFPREKAVVECYGDGVVLNDDGSRFRSYYSGNIRVWLRFRFDIEDQINRPLTEVLVSSLPLARQRRSPKRNVHKVTIQGVELGTSIETAKRTLGPPLREYRKDLGPMIKNLVVLEYFPQRLDLGSCIRIYIKDDTVVAFSFSSEE